ncbi:branched-chain amino acid ABC transporter permease [Burkholderiaceae bacterium]|jgi:branched-chain amino acid transport system permease protein|nr:branched-chain amino acid ABC transporter permease [Burkholderiaceae bacterium]MDG1107869.1 branched-chain amino acid ABC transporter permease [Burkholderiaceae bacterium]MDO7552706.1 branched-chain amino acid ABC transporter permease [Burkholderiaceae bacterium]MDO7580310.1 branched-chain amino acid ABC transporter permease [Burkholderiaceae bacterium]MDO7604433.1 branched-chain amino acid ABC transporter permease [Burkholderiaceae bacterium]|tara:strand:- start:3462 stop:4325 length:864 start_codon:yes stop_codon:yes gene_type:complete
MDTLIIGLLLGATYCLMALGLTLQYGVARIMNLAGGEWIVVGGFAAYWSFALQGVSPLWGFALAVPFAFVLNWLIYQYLLTPLIRRAKTRGALEVDSILATFGMSFIAVGLMRMAFGGEFFNYSFLAEPVLIFGSAFGLNRIFAAAVAIVFGVALYFWLVRSRTGMAMRALALSPSSAKLVAIDVQKLSLIAFSVGGAMSAAGGVVLSTFLTLDASVGVVFTMKALIIVIMGGVGNLKGAIVAALLLGMTESVIATWVDPGLTLAAAYLLFVVVLLVKPEGLFGTKS